MSPEQFLQFANVLPEPALLVAGDGVIHAANMAVEAQLGLSRARLIGRPLSELVTDPDPTVARYLLACSRSRSPVLGALSIMGSSQGPVRCRCDGAVLEAHPEAAQTRLMLRLTSQEVASRFIALNQKIDELNREVRRRHHIEEELLRQRELLQVTLNSIGDALLTTDAAGRVTFLNPVAEKLTGWENQEAKGQELREVFRTVDERTRQPGDDPVRRVLREGNLVGLANHTVLLARDGGERPIADSAAPIRDPRGELSGVVMVFRDVSEERRAANALRASEARFRELAEAMPQIVYVSEAEGRVEYTNRRWQEYTGRESAKELAEVVHPEDLPVMAESWAEARDRNQPFQFEFRLRRPDGSYRWFLTRSVPVLNAEGRAIRWYGTSLDIDERKRAEETANFLARVSEPLSNVTDYESTLRTIAWLAVPYFADWCAVDLGDSGGALRRVAVAHPDPDQVRLAEELMQKYPPSPDAPAGAMRVWRTGESELMAGLTDEMFVRGAHDEDHLRILRQLALRSYICVALRVVGKPFGVITFATAQSGRNFTPADLAVAEELARRASVAIENARLYEQLREADRRKDEFLAMLGHELRNPLAPVRNALQILKLRGSEPAIVARSREIMERQVEHLVRLVDDLLDVSRIMRGKVELRHASLDLGAVLWRAAETAQPAVDAAGHELVISLPDHPVTVRGDLVRLTQVFGNLLVNAAKYSDKAGQITVSLQQHGAEAVVRVKDQGIGIAQDQLSRIFELFAQVDRTETRSQGGLGIGLTLVKKLVEMHTGAVVARSEGLGSGSEFEVRLPAISRDPLEPNDMKAGESSATRPWRILVVDDNRDAADSMSSLLRLSGHEVRVAYDGPLGVEEALRFGPELVILDIGLPGMTGYEVARRIRERPELRNCLLAAMTGYGQDEDRRRSKEAGFDYHLVKPVEPSVIEHFIQLHNLTGPPSESRHRSENP